jgi:hypothetical protein
MSEVQEVMREVVLLVLMVALRAYMRPCLMQQQLTDQQPAGCWGWQ